MPSRLRSNLSECNPGMLHSSTLLIVARCDVWWPHSQSSRWYFAWTCWQEAHEFISGGLSDLVTECDVSWRNDCSLLTLGSPGPDYVTSWAPAPVGDTGPGLITQHYTGARGQRLARCGVWRSPGCHSSHLGPTWAGERWPQMEPRGGS